jgi:hypothetical protein
MGLWDEIKKSCKEGWDRGYNKGKVVNSLDFGKRVLKLNNELFIKQVKREAEYIYLKLGYNKYVIELEKLDRERKQLKHEWEHRYNGLKTINIIERLEFCERIVNTIHEEYEQLKNN